LDKKVCLKRILIIALALMMIPVTAFADNSIDAANKTKASLEKEKKKTEARLSELKRLKSDTAAYIAKIDQDLVEIQEEIDDVNEQIAQVKGAIAVKTEELANAEYTSDKQYGNMKLRIKYMYEQGQTSFIESLVSSKSLNDLLNKSEYVSRISVYDRHKLDEYQQTRENIAAAKVELEDQQAELETLQAVNEEKQTELNTLMEEKQAELDKYSEQIDMAKVDLATYEKEIKKQEDTIKAIEAEIKRREEEARKAALAAGKEYKTVNLGDVKFIWPCPASSRITSYFGTREQPVAGASTNHQGIDIGAGSGEKIIAAAAGEVIIATYSPSAGNYIMINHGGSVYTVYMHASELCVSAGDHVAQGATIAKVGSTGYSTGPHLHFGIRADGKYLNPLSYVSP